MTRIILVGGFLGAGKTTLLAKLAQILTDRGYRVGVVTNDQGSNLVDTALITLQDTAVSEVAGGCFCCRFPDLQTAVSQLQDSIQPDIILAEPVGSCTDLMATVIRPFMKYHADELTVAPLTILLDPTREIDGSLSDVTYLYEKQLAEADIIAINKSDLLDVSDLSRQLESLKDRYPLAEVKLLSAKTGDGLEDWLDTCLSQSSQANNHLDIDYEIYATAEAALGWLNARGKIESDIELNPIDWIESILDAINQLCQSKDIFIAHVKLHLRSDTGDYKASLIQTGGDILWDILPTSLSMLSSGEFIINARVTSTPEELEDIMTRALESTSSSDEVRFELLSSECFSPLPPEPTYHIRLNEIY